MWAIRAGTLATPSPLPQPKVGRPMPRGPRPAHGAPDSRVSGRSGESRVRERVSGCASEQGLPKEGAGLRILKAAGPAIQVNSCRRCGHSWCPAKVSQGGSRPGIPNLTSRPRGTALRGSCAGPGARGPWVPGAGPPDAHSEGAGTQPPLPRPSPSIPAGGSVAGGALGACSPGHGALPAARNFCPPRA